MKWIYHGSVLGALIRVLYYATERHKKPVSDNPTTAYRKLRTGPWLAAAVVALGSWHSWRLDLTEPRGLTDTTSDSRPNSPTAGAIGSFLSLESHNANSGRRR
jgi:hypothetical protein